MPLVSFSGILIYVVIYAVVYRSIDLGYKYFITGFFEFRLCINKDPKLYMELKKLYV